MNRRNVLWIVLGCFSFISACGGSAATTEAPPAVQQEPALTPSDEPLGEEIPEVEDEGEVGVQRSDIPCESVDDCWVDGIAPVARPAELRGRSFEVCADGEWEPTCAEGLCATVGADC